MDGVTIGAHCLFWRKTNPQWENFLAQMWKSILLYLLLRPISNFPICLSQVGMRKYGNAQRINWLRPIFFDKKFLISWIFAEIHSFWQLYHTYLYLNLWENTLFLASDAWQWLIYPSSSRPLLYGPNKISPSFMVRLTRSHLNRAFVWVALSFHTCSASESSRAYPSPDFVESIFRLYRPLSIKVVPK